MRDDERDDPMHRIADGLFAIAEALNNLGTANASTPMGAIEMLAKEVRDGSDRLASALSHRSEL